jgi:hypothetical protein
VAAEYAGAVSSDHNWTATNQESLETLLTRNSFKPFEIGLASAAELRPIATRRLRFKASLSDAPKKAEHG